VILYTEGDQINSTAVESVYKPHPPLHTRAKMQQSASRIQRAWRERFARRTLHQLVRRYLAVGVTSASARRMSFDELNNQLRKRSVVQAGKACLMRIHQLAVLHSRAQPNVRAVGEPRVNVRAVGAPSVNVRVVMAAYTIAYRPTHVFQTMGALEMALYNSARALIEAFEGICEHIVNSEHHSFAEVPAGLKERFPTLLLEYIGHFNAYRQLTPHEAIRRVEYALARLSGAHPPNQQIADEMAEVSRRLRARLVELGGPAGAV